MYVPQTAFKYVFEFSYTKTTALILFSVSEIINDLTLMSLNVASVATGLKSYLNVIILNCNFVLEPLLLLPFAVSHKSC